MEILNKASESYKEQARKLRMGPPKVHFTKNGRTFTINAAAVHKYGIKPGQFVHFVVDVDMLYFFVNDNPAGASLHYARNTPAVKAYSTTLTSIIKERLPNVNFMGSTFNTKESFTQLNGEKLIFIQLLNKRGPKS